MTVGVVFGMSTSPYTPVSLQGRGGHYGQVSPRFGSAVAMCSDLDVMKRDRFELLSAYLDGEVTPEERRLVQTWLHNDPTAKCLYNRLMALRYGLREDTCTTSCDPEVTLSGVFQCLNRRLRMVTMAGAGVAIVGILNLLSGTVGSGPARWSIAQGPNTVSGDTLHIAIDEPAFPIPAPVATPVDGRAMPLPSSFPVESEL